MLELNNNTIQQKDLKMHLIWIKNKIKSLKNLIVIIYVKSLKFYIKIFNI